MSEVESEPDGGVLVESDETAGRGVGSRVVGSSGMGAHRKRAGSRRERADRRGRDDEASS